MYIDKITLSNLKGFEHLEFDLRRPDGSYAGWTVFTGDNGSGKSTLLKAIALALTGCDTARALQPSFQRWVQEGHDEARIELSIVQVSGDDDLTKTGTKPQGPFPAAIALHRGTRETTPVNSPPRGKPKSYATPQRSIWSMDARGWFACGYGPFRRVFGASPEAMRQMVAPATERFVTMFDESASLAEVDQWLRNLSHKSLEGKESEKQQLALVKELLSDELMPNQISIDRIDSDGLWLKDRNGLLLSWKEMSDGYRAALALLTDILRHLINTYGVEGLTGRNAQGKLEITRSGVVLIDEIDAHLHPEWQREIGFWLKRHCPKIQFLVTTHSPIICQAADPHGLFVLPEPGSNKQPHRLDEAQYNKIISSRPDTILLTEAFGLEATRSPRAVEARKRHSQLKSKQRSGASLSTTEMTEMEQLALFVNNNEEL